MGNMEIYEKYRRVPEEAKKPITAGRLKGFTDINPMWRIKALTEAFGMCGVGWYTDIRDTRIEERDGEACVFMTINLFVKNGEEWSAPIIGIGGSKLATKERNGTYVSDECLKMAYTDALSVACKSLGMGADVYWEKDATKYSAPEPAKEVSPKDPITVPMQKALLATAAGKQVTEDALLQWLKCDSLAAVTIEKFNYAMAKMGAQ